MFLVAKIPFRIMLKKWLDFRSNIGFDICGRKPRSRHGTSSTVKRARKISFAIGPSNIGGCSEYMRVYIAVS